MANHKLGFQPDRRHVSAGLIIFSTIALLWGCGSSTVIPDSSVPVSTDSPTTAPTQTDPSPLETDISEIAEAQVSEPEIDSQPEVSESKAEVSESKAVDVDLSPPPQVASRPTGISSYNTRPLTAIELASIETDQLDFTPSRQVIADQSFAIKSSDGGEIYFVASQVEGKLFLDWKSPTSEGGYFALPVDEAIPDWYFLELKAISFGDFNQDGAGPDVIAIAEYVTGIGRSGSQPFPVATAYFQQSIYTHSTLPDLNQALAESKVSTIDRAVAVIDAHLALPSP